MSTPGLAGTMTPYPRKSKSNVIITPALSSLSIGKLLLLPLVFG